MPARKPNLWPFSSRKTAPKRKTARSSMTVAQATSAAFKAGKETGDTGLFRQWLEFAGLSGRGNVLTARLRKEYERGFESKMSAPKPKLGPYNAPPESREHKGRKIEAHEGGTFSVPSLERETRFDSIADAKRFIDSWRRNPKERPTDRALRYRANQTPPADPKQCAFCGSKDTIEIGHIDGHEEHGEPENLIWTCRSCNVIAGNTLRQANIGRLTHQYNPTKSGGAANVGEWMNAVGAIVPHKGAQYAGENYGLTSTMSTADAVAMIRATPAHKRSEFAGKIRTTKRGRRSSNPLSEQLESYNQKKRNPQADADALYESFHGRPSAETIVVEETIHEHEHLATLGTLTELIVETVTGLLVTITFDETDTPWLASSEDGKQLYIEGGDQELDLKALKMDGDEWVKDRMVIGQFAEPERRDKRFPQRDRRRHNITYRTKKSFDQFEEIDYQHDLGEETGIRPMLVYAPRDKHLYIEGGQYRIEMPLIGTSPGIEN